MLTTPLKQPTPGSKPKIPPVSFSVGPKGMIMTTLSEDGTYTPGFQELEIDFFADEPFMRDFVVASADTFIDSQELFQDCKDESREVRDSEVACISFTYRAGILQLIKNLQDAQYPDKAMLFSHLDFLWQFCEIMFITSHPDLPILPYLLNWIVTNFDKSDEAVREVHAEFPDLSAGNSPKIWEIIFSLSFQGRTATAAHYLQFIDIGEEERELMSELLIKMPLFIPGTSSLTEFESTWLIWRNECELRYMKRVFDSSREMKLLAMVLCGYEEGFEVAKDYLGTWYEYLAMIILFETPLLKPAALKAYAKKAIDEYDGGNPDEQVELTPEEEIIMEAMDFDIIAVLKDMQILWSNPWFPLHFSDMMYTAELYGPLNRDNRHGSQLVGLMRNDLVREYGSSLMQHRELWKLGVKYLAELPGRSGWPLIGELLIRIKITNDVQAERILYLLEKYDCASEVRSVCREITIRKMGEHLLQDALYWSIKGGNENLTSRIVDQLLKEGEIDVAPMIIQSIKHYTACGDRLVFLEKYCKFRQDLFAENFAEAFKGLCTMICTNIIPKRMAPKVLCHIQVMNEQELEILQEQTYIIANYVQNLGEEIFGRELFKGINYTLRRNRGSQLINSFNILKIKIRSDKVLMAKLHEDLK